MLGRSSPRDALSWCGTKAFRGALVALAIACGCKRTPQPEADPAHVASVADRMVRNSPVPAAVPACSDNDLQTTVTMTFRTLRVLAGHTLDQATHEIAEWVNPTVLDVAQARTILDANAEVTAKRRAAAALLNADSWIIYRVDLVNAPMALGVKELKTGTLTGRIIRYDRQTTRPTCVTQWAAQNSRDKTQWAISISNQPYIDPAVVQVLREDLAAHYVERVQRKAAPQRQ